MTSDRQALASSSENLPLHQNLPSNQMFNQGSMLIRFEVGARQNAIKSSAKRRCGDAIDNPEYENEEDLSAALSRGAKKKQFHMMMSLQYWILTSSHTKNI